jgi:tetratricopeptide (TPR) repeat protein
MRWTAGQLGRRGSQCRTVAEAFEYLGNAPSENDPLEYIFGDLLGTFTESETTVLGALTHFTQPAKVDWISTVAGLTVPQAEIALEDLNDRALLVADPSSRTFYLPPLTARFLREKRPETVNRTGDRLGERAFAIALENGSEKHERFPMLEAEWPLVAAALPRLAKGENARLQRLSSALDRFLDFSGRWDDWLWLSQEAEPRAIAEGDFSNAGWRAYRAGWVHRLRGQAAEVMSWAARAEAHWQKAGARERAFAIRLRGLGLQLEENYPEAIAAFRQSLELWRALDNEGEDVALVLNDIAGVEHKSGDYVAAERDYREALRIAKKADYSEGVAYITGNLASIAISRGEWAAAETMARESLTLSETLGRQEIIASNSCRLANVLAKQGRRDDGLPLVRRAVDIFTKLGQSANLAWAQSTLKKFDADPKP